MTCRAVRDWPCTGCVLWSPCVEPTLGATTTLASQGQNRTQIALLMLLFGLGGLAAGAARPDVAGHPDARIGRMTAAGKLGEQVLGALLLVTGVTILSGWDNYFGPGWCMFPYPG